MATMGQPVSAQEPRDVKKFKSTGRPGNKIEEFGGSARNVRAKEKRPYPAVASYRPLVNGVSLPSLTGESPGYLKKMTN